MKRDMMRIVGEGSEGVPMEYQLTASEIQELWGMVFQDGDLSDNLFDVFGILFQYGFQLGRRYEKRHGRNARKAAQAAKDQNGVKSLAVMELDSLRTEPAIEAASAFVHRLAEKEQELVGTHS